MLYAGGTHDGYRFQVFQEPSQTAALSASAGSELAAIAGHKLSCQLHHVQVKGWDWGGGAWWTQNQEGALWAWWSLVVHLNLQIMIHGSWTRNQGVLLALLTTAWFDLFLIVVLLFLSQYGIVVLLMDLLLEYYKGSLLIRSQCIDKREPLCLLLFGYQLFHLVSHKVVISRMFNFCCYLFIYCHLGRWFIKHT